MSNKLQGILWMISACVWGAAMICTVRYISLTIHPLEVVFFRNLCSLILMIPLVTHHGKKLFQTKKLHLYSLRTVIGLSTMELWFYTLSKVPLAQATALSFTSPMITSITAVIFLREKSNILRWISLSIGFLGTIIILKPGLAGFNATALLVLVASVSWSTSSLLIKTLTKTEPPEVIVFYMVLMMTPLSLPAAIPYWQTPDLQQTLWLFFLGLVSNFFQISLSKCFAKTDLTVTLPFDFIRLVFVSIIAYFAFGEKVDASTIAGAILILGSTFYLAYKESRQARKITERAVSQA